MKLQYLGDSKDSFKWDYHDYLTIGLGYPLLNIAFMMTPDDKSNEGESRPELFSARNEILKYCHSLREIKGDWFNETIPVMIQKKIRELPSVTGSKYGIVLHKPDVSFTNQNRKAYFSDFSVSKDQVVLLDPDNGFEPKKSLNRKHVSYTDIKEILHQISKNSVISVFQHFRRKQFTEDFAEIRVSLKDIYSTAIYWHSLMFVAISNSEDSIDRVIELNRNYADGKEKMEIIE
jgi:hypothetical protein